MDDYYDDDLPEIRPTWAESLQSSRDTVILLAKVTGVPLSAFIATCVFNYWVKKKIGSL